MNKTVTKRTVALVLAVLLTVNSLASVSAAETYENSLITNSYWR